MPYLRERKQCVLHDFVSEGKIQSIVFLDIYFSFLFKVVTVHNLVFSRVTHLSVTLISNIDLLSEEM